MQAKRAVLAVALSLGCTTEVVLEPDSGVRPDAAPDSGVVPSDAGPSDAGIVTIPIPPSTQRPGDPALGYAALVNEGYVGCGVPYSAFTTAFGAAPMNRRLPGRVGPNETLPYDYNAFTLPSGVTVVAATCLACHAAVFEDEVVLGLGDANRDFTNDVSQLVETVGFLVNDPEERVEWRKWADRMQATAPYIQTQVVGTNPADNLGLILFAHRDPITLAWSNTPLLEPPPTIPLPVDVPPWWRLAKKNALYYTAAGTGDHARLMMTASVLCVDDVAIAESIDAYFPDIRAYVATIEAPPYPGQIDMTKAAAGKTLFDSTCARCHGTYGPNGRYPNVLVALDQVGTDPWLASGSANEAERFVNWINTSFYGELSEFDPLPGYVAPPLDGIWLTAPFLHNGSVPDLRSLLDSPSRPTYFRRMFDGRNYDLGALGWPYVVEDHGHAGEPNAAQRKLIYDTTLIGHSNAGHTFGDHFSAEQRDAVLEYLKTL
jgi:mono/diheme cytochrome c family protein